MGKRRDRENDIIDRLQEENRKLKQAIRTLTRKLKHTNRGYYKIRDPKDLEEDEPDIKFNPDADKECFDCGDALKVVIIAGRRFRSCKGCGKRTKIKFINV